MPIALSSLKSLAATCAANECLITPSIAALALNSSLNLATDGLKMASDAGYFRPVFAPFGLHKIGYQPTLKALKLVTSPLNSIPKFLRPTLPKDAAGRGLLRSWVQFDGKPHLNFLSMAEQEIRAKSMGGAQKSGFAHVAMAADAGLLHIFVPVLPRENHFAALESACLRWLWVLQSAGAMLHFVTPIDNQKPLQDALNAFSGRGTVSTAADELAALAAEILADRTGLAAIKLSSRRATLAAKVAAEAAAPSQEYAWLGEVLGAH